MRLTTIVTVASLLLLLSACVPATGGTSSGRMPIELGRGTIEATPGQSIYVLSVNTMDELGFRDSDLEILSFVNESAQRSSARVSNWTSVTAVRLPAWWEVGLDEARIVSSAGKRSVQSVIRIDVPAQANLGPADVRVSLNGRRDSVVLTIPVRVRQQQN